MKVFYLIFIDFGQNCFPISLFEISLEIFADLEVGGDHDLMGEQAL
jgi:hypothetical protein